MYTDVPYMNLNKVLFEACIIILPFCSQAHAEEAEEKKVVVIEAKEVNGMPVAEGRSDAVYMDHPAEDQLAVESIDRDHTVYAPPPLNRLHGPIPVPVSLAAIPGSLVLPGFPIGQSRRPIYGPPQHRRQNLPRRPPPPVQKRPHPVRPNYAQAPSLAQIHRQRSVPRATFLPPPPPHGFSVPPHLQIPQLGNHVPLRKNTIPQQQIHIPQHQVHVPQQQIRVPQEVTNYSPPPPPAGLPGLHALKQKGPDFGDPKNNDLYQESESSISSAYSGPPPPLPIGNLRGSSGSTKQLNIGDAYVPPKESESRRPILNNVPELKGSGSGQANSYVPPTGSGAIESWPTAAPDMPQIVALDVKCEKNLMKVRIEFDKPFNGIIFSKGHYSNVHCVHLPAGLGRTHSTFDISINSCGTSGNTENGLYGYGSQSGSGTFFENTIVVQYDPQVQEVWDQARKLRCTWHDQYEKSVTFRPFSVDMLDVVRADFAGDNVGCWMQIQVGKGPWASEVSGLVKIGQTMTMVLAIKDDDNKFDMMVRNCMAHDGKRAPIQLVDQRGCITRPKLMSRFTKIKDFGASASVLSYAHFQAFKFPDSMEVHFQCTIQICRYQCPEQCSEGQTQGYSSGSVSSPRDHRKKREVDDADSDDNIEDQTDIGVNRVIQVVSKRDLTFVLDRNGTETEEYREVTKETLVSPGYEDIDGLICMSTPGFAATLVVLLGILIVSCLLSAFLCLRFRYTPNARSIISSYNNPAFLRKQDCFEY